MGIVSPVLVGFYVGSSQSFSQDVTSKLLCRLQKTETPIIPYNLHNITGHLISEQEQILVHRGTQEKCIVNLVNDAYL
jgi:hypothetical protein